MWPRKIKHPDEETRLQGWYQTLLIDVYKVFIAIGTAVFTILQAIYYGIRQLVYWATRRH